MEKTGLVFGGGGTKGIYQIGVWKAMKDLGIDKKINVVSGTSVGALNAVLFALGDYDLAFKIWGGIKKSDLLTPQKKHGEEKSKEGWFSRNELKNIIQDLPLKKLKNSKIDVYITTNKICNKEKSEEFMPNIFKEINRHFSTKDINDFDYHHINLMSIEDTIDILLASSAISLVYGSVYLNDERHIDAGATDFGNVPIIPLYNRNKCKEIYVVPLDNKYDIKKINKKILTKDTVNAEEYYENRKFTVIKPSKNLGLTFDLKKDRLDKNFKLGESDATKILKDKLHYENMKQKLQYTKELVKRYKK